MRISFPVRALLLSAIAVAVMPCVHADAGGDADLAALRARLTALRQRLDALEQDRQAREQEDAEAEASAPKITAGENGFAIASADGSASLRFRGLFHFDARRFFDDGGVEGNDTFLLRRARIILDGGLGRFGFRITPECSRSTFLLLDGYVTYTASNAFQIKAGKFKPPLGVEQFQSDSASFFIERSMAWNLTCDRDIGVQMMGECFGGTLSWNAGVFNGAPDGASLHAGYDDGRAAVMRLFARPFRNRGKSPLKGLGAGVGASWKPSASGASGLTPGFRTEGQQTFFAYNPDVAADGAQWRVLPQAHFYRGPLGILAECAFSTVSVRSGGGARAELRNTSWQAGAGWVLTGEDASYDGVVPLRPFGGPGGGWGAFEVAVRVARIDIDGGTFPVFADPAIAPSRAESLAIGINWYPVRQVRASIGWFQTRFDCAGQPGAVILKQDEKALITRLQLGF